MLAGIPLTESFDLQWGGQPCLLGINPNPLTMTNPALATVISKIVTSLAAMSSQFVILHSPKSLGCERAEKHAGECEC